MTAFYLSSRRFGILHGVIVVLFGLACEGTALQGQSIASMLFYGRSLGGEEVERLERLLVSRPDDIGARVPLIGYYSMRNPLGFPDQVEPEKATIHVTWLMVNAPESEFHQTGMLPASIRFGSETRIKRKSIWIRHLEESPGNLTILENALHYLRLGESEALRRACEEAMLQDPDNPLWAIRLAGFYLNKSLYQVRDTEDARVKVGQRALALFEQAYEVSSSLTKGTLLDSLAAAALAAEEWETAAGYAQRLVRVEGDSGLYLESLNHGNVIRGIALLNLGRHEEAAEHLLKSIQFPRRYDTRRFRPELSLAYYLWLKGEGVLVVEFLERCAEVFSDDAAHYFQLIDQVRKGGIEMEVLRGRY